MSDAAEKAYRVIESCDTFRQALIAGKYMRLAISSGRVGCHVSGEV